MHRTCPYLLNGVYFSYHLETLVDVLTCNHNHKLVFFHENDVVQVSLLCHGNLLCRDHMTVKESHVLKGDSCFLSDEALVVGVGCDAVSHDQILVQNHDIAVKDDQILMTVVVFSVNHLFWVGQTYQSDHKAYRFYHHQNLSVREASVCDHVHPTPLRARYDGRARVRNQNFWYRRRTSLHLERTRHNNHNLPFYTSTRCFQFDFVCEL